MTGIQILILFFVSASIVLVIYIIITLLVKNTKRKIYTRWTQLSNNIINNAVYSDDTILVDHQKRIENLLVEDGFRKILTKQIIFASKNFAGKSKESLKNMYLTLGLDKYVIQNANSKTWHVRANAIQEIGVLKLDNFYPLVFENTTHKNEMVRAEAQISIIKLIGFEGLKFLEKIENPISEWYQIVLLRELSYFSYESLQNIDVWLKSTNNTVVVFTLKLIGVYHLFEQYQNVINCLKHECPKTRNQAIKTLSIIFNGETAQTLVDLYKDEVVENKLQIIKSLQLIGTDKEIGFLYDQLSINNTELNIIIVRTIAKINPNKFNEISTSFSKSIPDIDLIVLQIKEEINV